MRNRSVAFVALFLALAGVAGLGAAEPVTVALSDFAVNSANPGYAYLGKGFAEIVAFELKKSKDLRLVDRERRNELLSEMEFALTGLTDPSAQLEIGKLLSVRYLVGGSITDMGGPLLVSLSMVDVESGEVVWRDQVTESGGKYAYIGAYFGKSLLRHFKVQVAKSTEASLAKAKEADAASVVALSAGIAALDKGDKAKAKKELALAKKIDPANAVAGFFLSRLASASAKFKVVPERYVSYFNPAYLGGMEKDRVFFNYSKGWQAYGTEDTNNDQLIATDDAGVFGAGEKRDGQSIGYAYPITPNLGLSLEAVLAKWGDSVVEKTVFDVYAQAGNQYVDYFGCIASLGLALNPRFSLGLGVLAERKHRQYYEVAWADSTYRYDDGWAFGGIAAAVARNRAGTLVWDVVAGYSNEKLDFYDRSLATPAFVAYGAPLYLEQTLTLALNGQTTFFALKQSNDAYFDRSLYYCRLMPCAEQWFLDLFSLRLGAEGSVVARGGATEFGWGATAGATVKIWKLELDANYTFRQRPSRSLEDVIIPESLLFITISASGLLKN